MDTSTCPACGAENPAGAPTCQQCGAALQPRAGSPALVSGVARWLRLDSFKAKLRAIAIVFFLAWVFSPFGPVAIAFGLARDAAGGAFPGGLGEALPGYIFLIALGAALFPTGRGGFIPGLEQALSGSISLTVLGWIIYIGVIAAIIFVKPNKIVRAVFIAFVLLVVWNTAGCYPIVQNFH